MAHLPHTTFRVPYSETVVCPVCGKGIPIWASVRLTNGSAQCTSTKGMTKMVSATIEARVEKIEFEHECPVAVDNE